MMSSISVVIPTHNRPKQVRALVEDLLQCDAVDSAEIIIVTNFPDPAVSALKRMSHGIQIHSVGRLGVNFARNLGLRKASGDLVLFLDDDCRVLSPKLLMDHLAHHNRRPEVIAIGGQYTLMDGASFWARTYHEVAFGWTEQVTEKNGETWALLGGHVSYKRDKLLERGFWFNQNIVFGGAEAELHLRLLRAGMKMVLIPSLVVGHDLKVTALGYVKKAFAQGFGEGAREAKGLRPPLGWKVPQNKDTSFLYRVAFDVGRELGRARLKRATALRVGFLLIKVSAKRFFAMRRAPVITHLVVLLRLALERPRDIREASMK